MNADSLDSLTERVLGAIFEVSNTLGVGFLEKVYQRALLRELGLRGIPATAEASFPVVYQGHCVGEYFADILVEDALVLELKCVERLAKDITFRLRSALDEAETFVTRMPTEKMGLLFLKDGNVVQPDPARLQDYQSHAGQRRGQWPASPEITAAMFERYREPPAPSR